MASKRIRKPPSRYVDDVESPFVTRTTPRTSVRAQETPVPSTEPHSETVVPVKTPNGRTNAMKTQAERASVSKQQNGRTDTVKPKNGRPAAKKSSSRPKKSAAPAKPKRPKLTFVDSDEERDHPDFYSNSSESETDESSSNSDDKGFDLLESSADDYFYGEDEDFETYSEASRGPTLSVASSSAYEDIPVCPWVEISPDRLPRLDLPSGSKDLLIDDSLLFDALEIYETCRNYYRTIRLSPFLFEDFCAALTSDEQSLLLAEIHIAFLKLSFKNDEEDQITLSVQDTNNSFNIIVHLVEPMTYAEVLRQYVESDPRRFPSDVAEALNGNYPFVDVRKRITVLSWLCDRFLNSNDYRNIIRNEGKLISDEHCRECGKQGDMVLCDGCEACYHMACANLTTLPEGQWLCQVCVLHQVPGVTDCGPLSNRTHRLPFRVTPLGYDRHGRRYWFAVRRIIVQDDVNGSVQYYSTLPQLHALLSRFAVGDLEKNLAVAVMNALPKIDEEMRKTLELTTGTAKHKGKQKEAYLVSDNLERMADIFTQPLACTSCESDDERTVAFFEGKPVEISKTMLLTKVEELLGFKDGLFSDLFWTSGLSAEKVLARRNNRDLDRAVASLSEQPVEEVLEPLGFRFGENKSFRDYQNQYSINDYAKTPHMRAKERDRKKYLCNRFSLAEEGAFEWCVPKAHYLYGSEASVANIMQYTVYKFAQRIPTALMHRLWRKDGLDIFTKDATAPTASVLQLRNLLLRFECGIRKPVMASVFWGTLGHTKLIRLTAEDRETRQMVDAKRKKMDRELIVADADDEESDVVWVKYTKLKGPPRHNIWRLKDEQYRVNGRGGLSGWLWVSRTMRRDIRGLPAKPPLGVTAQTEPHQLTSVAAKKAHRLAKLVDKISSWRTKENSVEIEKAQRSELLKCYSPTCRNGILPSNVCDDNSCQQQCYSVLCRQAAKNCIGMSTSAVVKARDFSKHNGANEAKSGNKKVMGEEIPFPLPVPFDFRVRRTGEQSLLVLPQMFLKRLARQGGRKTDFFAPGFHRIAKSNNQVWNYPCQRPLFDHCWRFLTLRARSYHAVALQLRILYACVRWADIERDEDEDEQVTIHHPDHDEVRTVVGHKEFPPDGLYERYKLKVQLIPLEDPNDVMEETGEDEEGYRPGRAIDLARSSRKRKVVSKVRDAGHNGIRNTSKMKTVEKWIDGVELKLWEIIAYWNSREVRKTSAHARDQLKSAAARASALSAANHRMVAETSGTTSKRRTQPRRLPEYDYDLSDEEYSRTRKQPRYEKERVPRYSRDRSVERESRELVYSEPRKPVRYSSERVTHYTSQRPSPSVRPTPHNSDKSEIYNSESPFNPRFRMRCHVVAGDRDGPLPVSRREVECLRGGGKLETSEGSDDRSTSNLQQPTSSEDIDRPGSGSPIDEPPLIPRYDNTNYDEVSSSQERIVSRTMPMQHRRVVYASPSSSNASVRPLASKVLMIRRADGTTQFLRPIAQSSSKDDRGQTRTVITTAQVGGSTMSEARKSMGISGYPQRVVSSGSVFSPRQIGNRSLVDHAGLVQQRRIVPALHGRPTYAQSQARIVRITPSNGQQPSTSSGVYSTTPLRVPSSTLGNGMILAEKDPFMKRMAAEKAISGTPTIYSNSPSPSVRRRPSGRDTYAGYYGEKSNDRIDVEEYQMLAEQGYRPPGRPPGRLASTFGYGPRVNQQRAILLARGGRGGLTPPYNGDGGAAVSPGSTRYDAGTSRVVQSPSRDELEEEEEGYEYWNAM